MHACTQTEVHAAGTQQYWQASQQKYDLHLKHRIQEFGPWAERNSMVLLSFELGFCCSIAYRDMETQGHIFECSNMYCMIIRQLTLESLNRTGGYRRTRTLQSGLPLPCWTWRSCHSRSCCQRHHAACQAWNQMITMWAEQLKLLIDHLNMWDYFSVLIILTLYISTFNYIV